MSNRILSYRGQMADGAIETILLSTKKGEVGFKINKFSLMSPNPGTTVFEAVMKIYKDPQSGTDTLVNFSDNRLLGAAFLSHDNGPQWSVTEIIFFDNEIVNQDIYITYKDGHGTTACNFYLELEMIKLSEDEAMVATLKDIRNNS